MQHLDLDDLKSLGEGQEHTCADTIHVNKDVLACYGQMVENRRWFHAHPELGFKELLDPTKLKQVLGWDKQQTVTLGFIKSRAIDLVRDGSIFEKLSYLAKG